jgi:hypothetical protein
MENIKENISTDKTQLENTDITENKKEYKTPTITRFGDVSSLVQANPGTGADMGSPGSTAS